MIDIEKIKNLLKYHIEYFNKSYNQFQNGRYFEAEKILEFINELEKKEKKEK